MMQTVSQTYAALVAGGRIEQDPAQEAVVARFDALVEALAARPAPATSGPLDWLFGQSAVEPEAPRGLYLHGGVGRGKTMLMDMFHEVAPAGSKRRVHFHAFMADAHERIHAHRQALKRGETREEDPIAPVAKALAEEAHLLCFDEFAVTDIADAMILGRLFKALFGHGVTVVATSNVAPGDLYRDGLNRALFTPFIALIEERMEVAPLESPTDYRLEKLGGSPVYLVPTGEEASRALDAIFDRLAGGASPRPVQLTVQGHPLDVPAQAGGVARLSFDDLCGRALGAADYSAVARNYHTVILEGVPVMDVGLRNEAKRFITLVDIFYERRTKLIVSADAEPADLYRAERGHEGFEFARTASRLIEMRSREYLALPRGQGVSGSSAGLVET